MRILKKMAVKVLDFLEYVGWIWMAVWGIIYVLDIFLLEI